MANESNLKPARTTSEARKLGKNGGIASGVARRKRKAMKEQLEMLLKLPVVDEDKKKEMIGIGLDDKELDNQMEMTLAIFKEALKGNTRAYELIRDTLGEKPADNLNIKDDTKATAFLESINKQISGNNE